MNLSRSGNRMPDAQVQKFYRSMQAHNIAMIRLVALTLVVINSVLLTLNLIFAPLPAFVPIHAFVLMISVMYYVISPLMKKMSMYKTPVRQQVFVLSYLSICLQSYAVGLIITQDDMVFYLLPLLCAATLFAMPPKVSVGFFAINHAFAMTGYILFVHDPISLWQNTVNATIMVVLAIVISRVVYNTGKNRFEQQLIVLDRNKQLKNVNARLERIANTDDLTNLLSRGAFLSYVEQAFHKAKDIERPCVLMMLDIDHLKTINDEYGHDAGDKVLKHIASVLSAICEQGICGRLSGDEFSIILENAELEDGRALAERLRARVEAEPVQTTEQSLSYTVSVGVAACCQRVEDVDQWFKYADRALYQAKENGRNRVCVIEPALDEENVMCDSV